MIIGYARVSTDDQNLDAQIDALTEAGAEKIFKETVTAKSKDRPELHKLLEQLRESDVVIVTKYDRLARSLKDLMGIVETIRERNAGFRSLGEDIDTTTPTGRLFFHIFGSIAEFERERIVERTHEGLEAARNPCRDRRIGRQVAEGSIRVDVVLADRIVILKSIPADIARQADMLKESAVALLGLVIIERAHRAEALIPLDLGPNDRNQLVDLAARLCGRSLRPGHGEQLGEGRASVLDAADRDVLDGPYQ